MRGGLGGWQVRRMWGVSVVYGMRWGGRVRATRMSETKPEADGVASMMGDSGSYRQLMLSEILATTEQLGKRIEERFPAAGLVGVCRDLERQCRETDANIAVLSRANYWIRGAVVLCVLILMAMVVGIVMGVAPRPEKPAVGEFLQGLEAGVNDAVFVGAAIWFLTRLEAAWKRRRAMRALHALRSLAHIVDMHQLTKDPERVTGRSRMLTQSSPKRQMTPFELLRYLDYCSEMLSLISKLAALHVQHFDDAQTMTAVRDIENLTLNLSQKIWQKIMILDRMLNPGD